MKILSLPMGADTGGVSASIARAFATADDPAWEFRAIISTLNFIEYERDLEWSKANVRAFWHWADVIHLHHNMIAVERLTKGWKDFHLPQRPYVVEFHGTGFREAPRLHIHQMRRHNAIGVVSTLDLWLQAPETTWLPCPVNIDTMQGYRMETNTDVIRIAHAPTNRQVKSTEGVIAAVDRLRSEGHPVELDLIEGETWDTCLERKARADIYFDQVKLGYGNNAIEAWGMGIPVIAGAQPATLAEMERRFGSLPFYRADDASIYEAMKALVTSPDLRAEYGERGLAHVRRFHDERVVVEQLKETYTRAMQQGKRRAA